MNEAEAIARMKFPGDQRPGKQRGGVMQIWVTKACNLGCYSCTQGSNLRDHQPAITVDQFETAVKTLIDYFGVVGVFGGNPATHPKFPELCEILRANIPKERCGLWCNHPLGHGAVMRQTFNPSASNLNVHMDRAAAAEFRRDWPECRIVGLDGDSRHSPTLVDLTEVVPDESERWDMISNCDINQKWSAMICVVKGELRGFFCEVAGRQAMYRGLDLGVPIETGWWRLPASAYVEQVREYCHHCSVPLRGRGELAVSNPIGIEQVSGIHVEGFRPKDPGRLVQIVTDREELGEVALMTNYLGNAK